MLDLPAYEDEATIKIRLIIAITAGPGLGVV
jgi:hypothetical protein